jgi:hypothetical protein
MTPREKLLVKIEKFIARTAMNEIAFGVKSCGNGKLVSRMRAGGRGPCVDTAAEIEAFIDNYRDAGRHRTRREANAA